MVGFEFHIIYLLNLIELNIAGVEYVCSSYKILQQLPTLINSFDYSYYLLCHLLI